MADIQVHGRSGYTALIKRIIDGAQQDLSGSTVFFEVPAAQLRVRCPVDAIEALSLRVTLSRAQVEQLPGTASPYAIVDETNLPVVLASGTIQRIGYKGDPSV